MRNRLCFTSLVLLALTAVGQQGPPPAAKTAVEELARIRSEYTDVLTLQGSAKAELLAIARILRLKPEFVVDQTAVSGEYCFKSGLGTMVHYARRPEETPEGVVYEFDASALIAAGLDPKRLAELPSLGQMEPGRWYYLPKGRIDPHHAHEMPGPTIAIAVSVR